MLTGIGAAYLVWLGLTGLARPAGPVPGAGADTAVGTGTWLRRAAKGAGTSGLNPMALLLFLTLLPPVHRPGRRLAGRRPDPAARCGPHRLLRRVVLAGQVVGACGSVACGARTRRSGTQVQRFGIDTRSRLDARLRDLPQMIAFGARGDVREWTEAERTSLRTLALAADSEIALRRSSGLM